MTTDNRIIEFGIESTTSSSLNPTYDMSPATTVTVLGHSVRILHLEDNITDRVLIHNWLTGQGIQTEFTSVCNQADFRAALQEKTFDIILSDKGLPGFDGLEALQIANKEYPLIPFVFVTGSIGEEAAIETMRAGATDYVLKDRLSRLVPAIERAIRESKQLSKARESEEKVREQATVLDKAQDAIVVTDVADRVLYWNKSAERIYGWSASEVMGRNISNAVLQNEACREAAKQVLWAHGAWTGELGIINREGCELIVESRRTLVRDEGGRPKSVLIIDTDITEKKQLELKFLRSQRMESIGALAGGIAHDLNNALTPLLISSELLRDCEDRDSRGRFLDVISSGAHRATALVKQILSFARGTGGQSGPINLGHLIRDIAKMIQDTFPKSIALSVVMDQREMWTVQGDPTQLHQVLLNLCVNARDAMPQGGQLVMSAQNVMLKEKTLAGHGTPGSYVVISVTDTGGGISPTVLPHIFEPFFTTKIGGKGTGLGLSTVEGIVKHYGGFVEVQTKMGQGTQFDVYLPATIGGDVSEETKEQVLPTGHGELILLVEDEEAVRELTKTTLETYGYRVVTAQNGIQGIDRFKELENDIGLVITDTDMPFLDGAGVARAIKELKPKMPVIIASGFTQETEYQGRGDIALVMMEKPYRLDQLLLTVDAALSDETANRAK
jgi:two-component system cell cycle sensor histidine kinase/response regulator CckA